MDTWLVGGIPDRFFQEKASQQNSYRKPTKDILLRAMTFETCWPLPVTRLLMANCRFTCLPCRMNKDRSFHQPHKSSSSMNEANCTLQLKLKAWRHLMFSHGIRNHLRRRCRGFVYLLNDFPCKGCNAIICDTKQNTLGRSLICTVTLGHSARDDKDGWNWITRWHSVWRPNRLKINQFSGIQLLNKRYYIAIIITES